MEVFLMSEHKKFTSNVGGQEIIVETGKLEELANSLHENYFSCNGLRKVLFNGQ